MALSDRYTLLRGAGVATLPTCSWPDHTKRRNSVKLLSIIAIITMVTFSLNATDLAGAWKGSMETQVGKTDVTITLTPGAALGGKVSIGEYEAPIEKAKLDGAGLAFEINIEHGKVAFEGKVEGDEMKFTVTGTQGDKYSLICKRQK